MDVRCPHCGEPYDTDCFHNGSDDFSGIYRLFRRYGCGIMDDVDSGLPSKSIAKKHCEHKPIFDDEAIDGIRVIYHLNGDDVDGAASDTEFFFRSNF
jgi:hypothetical protein